ncbi:CO(2)-response secreted protease [Actinidia chinensis var. chinensis]|uniref:CO(2)-response secreted protease n=1 Tax=Actinidia chinensis var. chinensis TaxID=1590841 RepID=A0A2R6R8N3_ACTCC|nr:CO(2)-response secreted protease [Actinidia chinensis var. chinensis]
MTTLQQLYLVFCLFFLLTSPIISNQNPQPYVIYMGSSSNGKGVHGATAIAKLAHLQLLSSVIPSQDSERIYFLHYYSHAFKGFSAMLTENEASILSGHDEVVSIFPDPVLQLHTTRSWDFLEAASGIQSNYEYQNISSDAIIGVIDTGIWPESPSFKDDGIGEIPSRWKGVCMEGSDFKKSSCNRKIIGARYYGIKEFSVQSKSNSNKTHRMTGSPRDFDGHGTHTASTAAGATVGNASYYGLARGVARGGYPSTRIAIYKACSLEGCSGSVILKAIDDAIKDGVDIISMSIGMNFNFESDLLHDPIALGAFHAQEMGVLVVCSGGNDGPDPFTVVNSAPWMVTVAASSIDRDFKSTILLGNGKIFQGSGISLSNLTRSNTYPITFGEEVASDFTPFSEARNCFPGSLNSRKVEGKIIVCTSTDPSIPRAIKKLVVEDDKAKGLVLIDEAEKDLPFDSGIFPFSEVGNIVGSQILNYINSTKNPTATILPTTETRRFKPAPIVAYFSSRGPGWLTQNILKPDVMAPGVAILAATIPNKEEGSVPNGRKPSPFALRSGTSMACPHVSGAAAFIKSVHHKWSSAMIKSALMTTATVSNNIGRPLTNSSNHTSNPHEIGAGEINPLKALDPGLVFETTPIDYLNFFCYYGISQKKIRVISQTNFSCPKHSSEDRISNINYPSISIGKLDRNQGAKIVRRTVTNVGSPNALYVSSVDAPPGLVVKIYPTKIAFSKNSRRASFRVLFQSKEASRGYNFGAITLSDDRHVVRIVFAVNID